MIIECCQFVKHQIINFIEQFKKLVKNDWHKISCVDCSNFTIVVLDFCPSHRKHTNVLVFLYLFFVFIGNIEPFSLIYA